MTDLTLAVKELVVPCIQCESERTRKDGQTRLGGQRWRCTACGRRFTARSTSAFSNHGFPDDVIALAVRWYIHYRLSYADVVEWFAERGLVVDRSTIYRRVQRFLPLFHEAAKVHRQPVGGKWRVDETYTRLAGTWTYIYRAIDEAGQVVDAYFSTRRNAAAAEAFFRRAIDATGSTPTPVTTDKAKCYLPALRTVLPNVERLVSDNDSGKTGPFDLNERLGAVSASNLALFGHTQSGSSGSSLSLGRMPENARSLASRRRYPCPHAAPGARGGDQSPTQPPACKEGPVSPHGATNRHSTGQALAPTRPCGR